MTAIATVASFSACTESTASKDIAPVVLKFNFKPGKTYRYWLDSHLDLQPEINGKPIAISQDMRIVAGYKVLEIDSNRKKISITYERITMRSGNSILSKQYDSDDTSAHDGLFNSVDNLVKKPFTMTINDIGQVVSYDGYGTKSTSDDYISDSSVRKMMMQTLNVYPNKPVKPGDTWKRAFSTSVGFLSMNIVNIYKLASVQNDTAHIELTSTISPADSGMAMGARVKGIQNGNIEIDVPTGMILSARITQELSGTLNMTGKDENVTAKASIEITGNKNDEQP